MIWLYEAGDPDLSRSSSRSWSEWSESSDSWSQMIKHRETSDSNHPLCKASDLDVLLLEVSWSSFAKPDFYHSDLCLPPLFNDKKMYCPPFRALKKVLTPTENVPQVIQSFSATSLTGAMVQYRCYITWIKYASIVQVGKPFQSL